MNSFSRVTTALVLASSVLTGSVAVVAQSTKSTEANQTSNTSQTDPKKTQTSAPTQAPATQAPTTQARSTKPLATNEDPSMIGKRNINGGLIIPKLAGSTEKEVRQGREAAAEVDRQAKFIEDPMITEYVNRVGQNIVLHSDAKVPFTIKVIDSDEVNAFALPGGFFYVNKGLLLAADNEAELAGVMAHEIAHVAARHASETNSKGTLFQIGMIPAIILTGGVLGTAIQEISQIALPMGMFKFTRAAEKEADFLGLEYMYLTGYDPAATISFFEKLQATESSRKVNSLFASHPPTPDRVEAEKKHIEMVLPDREQYIVTTSEFDKVKARLAQLDNRRPAERQGPSLQRGRQGGSRPAPPDDNSSPSTRPDDKAPSQDDRPTLKRTDGTADPSTTTTK